jgi:hypothetical protein
MEKFYKNWLCNFRSENQTKKEPTKQKVYQLQYAVI